jgi:hypothetical protein
MDHFTPLNYHAHFLALDLVDGGARHFAETIRKIKQK